MIAIAQIPVVIVSLPAIIYIWNSSEHGTLAAIVFTVLLAQGYQIFMHWVDTNPDTVTAAPEPKPEADNG